MPFSISNKPSLSEISDAINYLLANFSQVQAVNPNSGQITTSSFGVVGYLYKYLNVKYADSFDGSVNFSDSPTNRLYYGLRNNNSSVESTLYSDYVWTPVTGGFGTTKFFYYATSGGRQIQTTVATTAPASGWAVDPGTAIDLDIVTYVLASVTSFSAGTTGLTPNTPTQGAVVLAGTLGIANGGTNGTATPTAGAVAYGTGTAYGFTAAGTAGQVLTSAGAGVPTWTTNASGDVSGPASSTDNAVARFDGTTGKIIQNSVTTIDDTGNASGILSQQFSNGSAVTLAAGKFWYDGSTGAWNMGMGNGNITQQVGEEIFVYGKASAAITDSPLQIIYHTGVVGASGVIKFAPTIAGITDVNAIIGIATESLALNDFGRATVFGVVRGITTNGTAFGEVWADDDVIWYDPVTGNPTKVEPVAPNIKVQVGLVIKAGAGGSGSFQVGISRGSKLGGTDSNVQFGTLANNNLISYDSTLGYWKNITTGTGVVTALGVNTGSAGAFVVNGGALGTPSSGTVTNLTGTASININGTVGATTANTGAFTTLSSTGNTTLGDNTAVDNVTVNAYMGIGGAGTVNKALTVSSTLSGSNPIGVDIRTANTATGGSVMASLATGGSGSLTANSGSAISAYGCYLSEPNVIVTSGSVTNAATVFINEGPTEGGTLNANLYTNAATGTNKYNIYASGTAQNYFAGNVLIFGAGALGYATGSGGTVTQGTSRTTGVTLNKTNGAITMFSAAGSMVAATFTVTNSTVAATDTIILNQKSGTNLYVLLVTAVAAGSFNITFYTTGGVATDAPVINFSVIKAVTA